MAKNWLKVNGNVNAMKDSKKIIKNKDKNNQNNPDNTI